MVLVLCMSAPAEAAKRKSCRAKDATTVASNRTARIYERDATVNDDPAGSKLIACIRSTGRRILLASAFDDGLTQSESYDKVVLRGRYVAWYSVAEDVSCKAACPPDYDATTELVEVYNLARRKRRSTFGVPAGDLALTRKGGLAWAEGSGTAVEVHALDKDGHRQLDSGAIEIASLAAEITIVSWKKSGVEYFARLR